MMSPRQRLQADGLVGHVEVGRQLCVDRDQPVLAADFHPVTGKIDDRELHAARLSAEGDQRTPHVVKGRVGQCLDLEPEPLERC
jgi:hypothetical protein